MSKCVFAMPKSIVDMPIRRAAIPWYHYLLNMLCVFFFSRHVDVLYLWTLGQKRAPSFMSTATSIKPLDPRIDSQMKLSHWALQHGDSLATSWLKMILQARISLLKIWRWGPTIPQSPIRCGSPSKTVYGRSAGPSMTFNQMSGAPTVGGGLKSMMLMWETQKQNAHHLFVELPSDEH